MLKTRALNGSRHQSSNNNAQSMLPNMIKNNQNETSANRRTLDHKLAGSQPRAESGRIDKKRGTTSGGGTKPVTIRKPSSPRS